MVKGRVIDMAKDSHKPPSRIKYERSHPTLSCRLDKQTHDLLYKRLKDNGLSFADFVKSQLGVLELKIPDVKKIQNEAYQKGYAKAINEYRIQLLCQKCWKPMTVMPNDNLHKAIREQIEGVWFHSNCVER